MPQISNSGRNNVYCFTPPETGRLESLTALLNSQSKNCLDACARSRSKWKNNTAMIQKTIRYPLLVLLMISAGCVFCVTPAAGREPDVFWTYKKVGDKELQMSVFLPEGYGNGSQSEYPAIVYFHGGSWRSGEASWHYPDCEYWSRRGMIAVSVDYRLQNRDNVEVPLECVKDARSAVRFLRGNASDLLVDPDAIVVAGGSAGGQLAAALATIQPGQSSHGDDDHSVRCDPNAVVLYNPWFKCREDLSPPAFIREGLPPFITFSGDEDHGIPVEEMEAFHESLADSGNDSSLYIGFGGPHGFCNGRNPRNPFFYWSLELADQFLVRIGILDGESVVQVPDGVALPGEDGFATYLSDAARVHQPDERPKPNVVLILVDDLGWQDVKCYDIDEPSPYETPRIDRLASRGVQFWQAYSPAPTCSPTRCAIMSGNHPARAQKTHVVGGSPPIPHNRNGSRMMSPWYSGRMPENEMTLARVLQHSGYVTGHCGKWHMAINHHAYPQPEDQGFDWTRSDRGTTASMRPDRVSGFATTAEEDPYRLDENGFPCHQNSEDALTFLRDHKDKPFFLYYATWLVHSPIHTRSRVLLDKYCEKLGVRPEEDPQTWSGEGQTNPFYCAMVEQLDYYVGQVFDYLEQTEDPRWPGHMLSENTYVIFTSDNGGMEGTSTEIYTDNYPLDRGKISAMEGGTRVPLIICGPGIEAGVESDVMVNGLDFFPTVLSLLDIEKPDDKQLDGCDLARLLRNNPADPSLVQEADGSVRDTMVWHFPHSVALESTIRVGDYKLVRNYNHVNNNQCDELELYRLYRTEDGRQVRVDIEESQNLAEALPDKVQELNSRLTDLLESMDASYPYYNPGYRRELPGREVVPTVTGHQCDGADVVFAYQENGARVERANLIYTLNGGARYEEWFRVPAELGADLSITATLPENTTHYFINLIDENNFLVSFPQPPDATTLSREPGKFSEHALAVTQNTSAPALEHTGHNPVDSSTAQAETQLEQHSILVPATVESGAEVPTSDSIELEPPSAESYVWTTDHMHVGVRWQPFDGRPLNNAFDANRPVINEDSSYAQFWVAWAGAEPDQQNTDYENHLSRYLQTIETAVDECVARGIKVEFVFFHCPAWASVSGNAGGWKPKPDHYSAFVTRVAEYFEGRVDGYQLSHEANLKGFMEDGDVEYLISEVYIKGARAIRSVYEAEPATPVIISTSGCSPCQTCGVVTGLKGIGGEAVDDFYNKQVSNSELMGLVDAINLNVSDHFDGYGNMDGSFVPSAWGNYDLIRGKLDEAGYRGKAVLSAESWITWDGGRQAIDVNGDGVSDEQDAYDKAITILGQCIERGLNTINLPWSDNSSGWAMGLTKRRDYNGRVRSLMPEIVVSANDGGPDIVTRKLALRGSDESFQITDGSGDVYSVDQYINPPDPNHLHYYIWRWYAQIAGGSDEVIRHAVAGEHGNDIAVLGRGFTGAERYRLSSFNRTQNKFTVLVYSGGASGTQRAKVSIPSTIQTGWHYNNEFSSCDFRGEGFEDGVSYYCRIVTKDINRETGADENVVQIETDSIPVINGTLTVDVPGMNRFTTIEFMRADSR